MSAFTSADLVFDPAAHTYTLPDERQVPSVTTILKACGISTDFEAVAAMSQEKRDQIEYARALGSAVHADCHAFDDGALDESTVHQDVRPYLDAWKVFRENYRLAPLTRERMVFDPRYFYSGTLDGIFRLPSGRLVLVDIKTGDPEDAGGCYQTAAYLAAWALEHTDMLVCERWCVRLTPENAIPYRVFPYTDWRDFTKFASFCSTFHEKNSRRKLA